MSERFPGSEATQDLQTPTSAWEFLTSPKLGQAASP